MGGSIDLTGENVEELRRYDYIEENRGDEIIHIRE
jgi:hypothetical protein